MSCFQFPQKWPAEEVNLTFDFTARLPGADVITAIVGVPVVAVNSGADPAPQDILGDPATIAEGGKAVTVPVDGGVAGASYLITVTVDTPVGRLVLSGLLPITPALADCT